MARRIWQTPVALALALVGVFTGVLLFLQHPTKIVTLGGHSYVAVIPTSEAEFTRGLSGTSSLPRDRAMLFIFQKDDYWAFWMKDMRYAIDMVWLNAHKQVVWVVHGATPGSYPRTFAPPTAARYVLEVPAGSAAHVKTGDIAAF